MCIDCWKERGSPAIVNEAIAQTARLINNVFEHHHGGGNLHIILADWNISDDDIEFCRQLLISGKYPTPRKELKAEAMCLQAFKQLSESQRATALALQAGFISP